MGALLVTCAVARSQSVVDGFNPGANNEVYAIVVQADGKILVGGNFTTLGGGGTGTTTRNYLGRLNADGSLDPSFNPGANGFVTTIAVQPDGKILVGGKFTTLGGGGTGTTTRNYLGRLNPDGSLDTSFNPGLNASVAVVAMQPDGKILVGGFFTTMGGGGAGTATRNKIGRLNVDGSLDSGFNPLVADQGAVVFAVAVQPDGKVLVGGAFFTPLDGLGNNIARFNTDGSIDTSFNPGANNWVQAIAVQPDGKILVRGLFTTLGGGGTGTTTRHRLGRLNVDGSLDSGFDPGANGQLSALALQPDGKIVVGGEFTMLGGGGTGTTTRHRLGRLNADGSVDMSFDSSANFAVEVLAVQQDGKILVGGGFTGLGGRTGTTVRNHIGQLTPSGKPAYPVIFVHGTCATSSTWTFLDQLPSLGWKPGGILTGIGQTNTPDGDFYTVTFNDPFITNGLGVWSTDLSLFLSRLNQARQKAGLAPTKFIVVAHSAGGLAARGYLQSTQYRGDIHHLVTYGTPHSGTNGANHRRLVESFLACDAPQWLKSQGVEDMQPDSPYLHTLNHQIFPTATLYTSLMGQGSGPCGIGLSHAFIDGVDDCVVPTQSQDISAVHSPPAASLVAKRTTARNHDQETSDVTNILWAIGRQGALSTSQLVIRVASPIDITVLDPLGRQISKDTNQIPWASYEELQEDDGSRHPTVVIPFAELGQYGIQIEPHLDALVTDRYSISVQRNDVTTVVADNVELQTTPGDGYAFSMTVQAPTVIGHPSNQTVTAGETAWLTALSSGTPTPAYQWQESTDGGASWTILADTAAYGGTATATLAVINAAVALNGRQYRAVTTNSAGSVTSAAATLTIYGPGSLTPYRLRFGGTKIAESTALEAVTPAQTVTVAFTGAPSAWTASANQPWLQITNGSGTGTGQFTVSIVNPGNVIGASTSMVATITMTPASVNNSPLTMPVSLLVNPPGTTAAPFGAFDTPANGAVVAGAIPVTGWALDDVGVQTVQLWRNCVDAIDRPAGACTAAAPGGTADFVFIAGVAFLAGARPDVESSAGVGSPQAYRAGWGYLMSTNAFPHVTATAASQGGQGTFTLSAYAVDVEGHFTLLGTKTIIADNDHATIPFGVIDTPDQGGTVTTNVYSNFGWAMTQVGKCIDTSSVSAYRVYIDGVSRTLTPGVNWFPGLNRSDIAAAYPGYCNTTNALAAYYIDLDALGLANGLHTIGWDIIDDQGNVAGVGSRFFIVTR